MSELEEIKKLPPEERIKRLKEVEEQRRKEIEEAEGLITDSMREIGEATAKIPLKQVKAGDISQLMTAEEKGIFKTARFQNGKQPAEEPATEKPREQTLEEMAHEEAAKKTWQKGKPVIYGQALEEARKGLDYHAHMTTTGTDTRAKEGIGEIYGTKTVTGENEEPRSMYERQSVEEKTSGMYGKKDEKKREAWQI
jgi:hypothetical protein